MLAVVWRPAVQCNECSYPNDDCFQFCQRCGLQRYGSNALGPSSKKFKIDLEQLEARIKHLDSARASTAYQRQKSQLEVEFSGSLESLQPPKSLFSATPREIVRFLVWKDGKGKTMVHKDSCQFFGLQGKQSCNCPTRLSAGTVDSLIGKLRSIFNALGRTSDWDDRFGSGNPASHLCVKQYLKSIQSEQSQARVSPKQATPVFFDKYKKLVYHLRQLLSGNNISSSERYIYARDLAFFSLDFFSGDRASDLGRIKTVDVLRHRDGSSLLFHQRVGKTLRGKTSRAFAVKQTVNPAICSLRNLQFFVELCNSMRLDLSVGFLFRPTSKKGGVFNAPFSPLPFKPEWSSTFHLSASVMVKLCTVLDPEPPSFLEFSECLVRLLPSTLAGSLRRWLTTILKWTRSCLPIPLPIPWLVVLLTLDTALRQNFSGTLVLRQPFCKSFPVFIVFSF